MAKRPRTPAQLANDQKLKEQAAQRRAAQNTESTTAPAETVQPSPTANATSVDEGVENVQGNEAEKDRIARLEAQLDLLLKMQGAQPNQNAPVTTKAPYSLDLSIYDSPVEKLMEWATTDARMRRQGFVDNYELKFVREIPARFPLADGSYMQVPKFTLGLLEVAYDDDGNIMTRVNERGEEVQIKYLRKRLVMFEDPDNALLVAHRKGLKLTDQTSQQFLNDMRYLQAQDWLMEVFYPPKSTNQPAMREEAIGGQMVTIVEDPLLLNQVDREHQLRM